MQGWIALHKSLLDWEWYGEPNTFRLFVHCLLAANYEPRKWRGVTIDRGQLVIGRDKLAETLGMTLGQLRRAESRLIGSGCLVANSTNKYTTYTVVKYEEYQGASKPKTNKKQTNNKPTTTPKQVNKETNTITPSSGRMREEWIIPEDWIVFATREGLSQQEALNQAAKFKDHWLAESGPKAVKQNWKAAWRNWVRNQIKWNAEKKGASNAKPNSTKTDQLNAIHAAALEHERKKHAASQGEGYASTPDGAEAGGAPFTAIGHTGANN